ncbi:MAG: hypothetical protein QOE83_2251 [Actinomycetota bacterium]|jgi:hypothetical protein|nr:hypothetical protein [Actinomycetota bacterium]
MSSSETAWEALGDLGATERRDVESVTTDEATSWNSQDSSGSAKSRLCEADRRCRLYSVTSEFAGFDEVLKALHACADGENMLGAYRMLKEQYFPVWGYEFSYDSLNHHVLHHEGRHTRAEQELIEAAERSGVHGARTDSGRQLKEVRRALLTLALEQLEAGNIKITMRDYIRLAKVDIQAELEERGYQEQIREARAEVRLLRRALTQLTNSTGRALTVSGRDEVRARLRASRSPQAALVALGSVRGWNDFDARSDDETEYELARAKRRELVLTSVLEQIAEGASPSKATAGVRGAVRSLRELDPLIRRLRAVDALG